LDFRFGGCGRLCGCWLLGGSEEFWGVLPFACRSSSSIRACNSTTFAKSRRMMAWASGGWRAMISSVIPGNMPLLLPNTALRVQISLARKLLQAVDNYSGWLRSTR